MFDASVKCLDHSEAGALGSIMQLESHSQLNPFRSYGEINLISGLMKPINLRFVLLICHIL